MRILHVLALTITFILFYTLTAYTYAYADTYSFFGVGRTVFTDRCSTGVWCYNGSRWLTYKDYTSVSGRVGFGGYWRRSWGWELAYSNLGKVSLVSNFPSDSDSLSCNPADCKRVWVASGLGKIQGIEGLILRYFPVDRNTNLYLQGGVYAFKGYWQQRGHRVKGLPYESESFTWGYAYTVTKYGLVPVIGVGSVYKNIFAVSLMRYGIDPVPFADALGEGSIDSAKIIWLGVRHPW